MYLRIVQISPPLVDEFKIWKVIIHLILRIQQLHVHQEFTKMAVITLPPLDVRFNEKIGLEIATTELSSPKQDNDILALVQKATYTNDANLLKVSPYDEIPHLLNLTTVDIPNQILAKALVGMESLREDYATAPYVETFNWTQIQKNVQAVAQNASFDWKETSFYIVVFRSRIPPTTVYADLGVLDKAAHAEATASGGFLK